MRQSIRNLAALALLGLGAGCTSGNSGLEPPFTAINLNSNKVQLAVGVATFYGAGGTVAQGLNTVVTFRQPNGLSGTLLNTPSLTGPFTVPNASSAGTDAGTNHITGSPQALPGTTAVATTFGQSGGAFAYGFAPENSTTSGAAQFGVYSQPFYGSLDAGKARFIGGPPAYPNPKQPSYPTGFNGYPQGFTVFALTPVAGAYNLSVNVPSANNAGATLTAPTATLASTAGLPAFVAAPAFTSTTNGGGTATCTAPAGVTETIVDLQDTTAGNYYTIVVQGGGNVTANFADNLGPVSGSGVISPTIAMGDNYTVRCIGVNYPAFEAGPPGNVNQLPTIVGGNGQADVTISPTTGGAY